MGDTYMGICKKCETETDLIDGVCMDCTEKKEEVEDERESRKVISNIQKKN